MIERITIDTRGVVSRLDKMSTEVKRALVKSTNELGRAAEKTAKKGLKEEYNVDPAYIDQGLHRTPAQRGSSYQGRTRAERLFTVITARGSSLPLYKFGAIPQVPPAQKGRPISTRPMASVQILRKAPRRFVTPDPHTGNVPFIARMPFGFPSYSNNGMSRTRTNHVGVFVRTSKVLRNSTLNYVGRVLGRISGSHQVIRELPSLGLADMFGKRGAEAMRKLIAERGTAVFQKSLEFVRRKKT